MNPAAPLLVASGIGLLVHLVTAARYHHRISLAARAQVGLINPDTQTAPRTSIDPWLAAKALIAGGLGFALVGPLGLTAGAVPWLVSRSLTSRRRRVRQAALDSALGSSLQLIIDQLRVGRDLTGALQTVAGSAIAPLDEVLNQVLDEVRLGVPLHEAIESAARLEQNRHFDVIASAVGLHAHHGGSLTEILATVAESIEAEDELQREIETLTAEGRLSAQVLMGLPIAALGLLSVLSPGYAAPLFTTSAGQTLTIVALVLGFAGWVWLRALSQSGAPL
jgi:tight adherence protein B